MEPKFDLRRACRNLDIEIKPFGYTGFPNFTMDERGVRGYSIDNFLCINPDERWPEFVTFHEMTHILNGDTTDYERFGISKAMMQAGRAGLHIPSPDEMVKMEQLHIWREKVHDMKESECHATAIITAAITDTPFDIADEIRHLVQCYTLGRDIPVRVMERCYHTARRIEAAGRK